MKRVFRIIRQSLNGEEVDYTNIPIRSAVFLLAIPMILELSLESVFAIVYMYFVGKLGSNAIATVGLTESLISIIYSIAMGVSTAATAIIARRVGEKHLEQAADSAAQAISLSIVLGIIFGCLGIYIAEDLLYFMGASKTLVDEGVIFTKVLMGGSLSIILLFMINGIFRGAGNAAIAMKSLWIASLLNIVLCPILIYQYGILGAALATLIGRTGGVVYQIYQLINQKGLIKISWKNFYVQFELIQSIFKIAWPATFQFFISSGSWIVLSKLVAETGGTEASAAYQIAIRNVVFFILPAWGLSNAAATLVGQNLGAGKPERVVASVRLSAIYNGAFMGIVMLLFVFFSKQIIGFYTNDSALIEIGSRALQIIAYGYLFYGVGMVMTQALNGAGDTKTPTWIFILGFWLIQIPLAYYLAKPLGFGPDGVFWAIPIAETFMALISTYFFYRGKWKTIQV